MGSGGDDQLRRVVVEVGIRSLALDGIARDVKGEYNKDNDGNEAGEEGHGGPSSHGLEQGPRR